MRQRPAARRPERGPVGVKRLRASRKPMSARVVGSVGSRVQDKRRARPGRMTPLLKRLRSEVGDMRDQGNALTKQMLLLYSTFEDFVKVKHPAEHGRRPRKSSRKSGGKEKDTDHEWLKHSGISFDSDRSSAESEQGGEAGDSSIEQPRTARGERQLDLTVSRIPICDMDPVMMSDMDDSQSHYVELTAPTARRSPEKRCKDRLSIGDTTHRSNKKAKRGELVVDKAVAPAADADKSVELFPWPLSVEHKKALEASGLSVVRDSLLASPDSESDSLGDSTATTGCSPAETAATGHRSKPEAEQQQAITATATDGDGRPEVREEEIDGMLGSSPRAQQKAAALPARRVRAGPNKASAGARTGGQQQPIYENVDFVRTCHADRTSADSSGAAAVTTAGEATAHTSIVSIDCSLVNIDNKGLNRVNVGGGLLQGLMFPDPHSPAVDFSLVSSRRSSSPRPLQRSLSAENLSVEKEEEFYRDTASPVYENIPRSLRGQVSPPRRFIMSAAAGAATLTLPKPRPKHSSTPFRIDLDTLTIHDFTLGASMASMTSMNTLSSSFMSSVADDSRVDLTLGMTPRQSAFRPYHPVQERPVFTECLRTQTVDPAYICMSRRQRREATRGVSKKLFGTPGTTGTPARALDLTESGYASSKMIARRLKSLEPDLTYDQAPPSVDSGRGGSVSPTDDSNGPLKLASVSCDPTIDLTTVTEPEADGGCGTGGDPIYESIADCGVYSRVADCTSFSLLPDLTISVGEHTYDKIDDITASTLVESPQPPSPPPARSSFPVLPLVINANTDKGMTATGKPSMLPAAPHNTLAYPRQSMTLDQAVKKSDLIDHDDYHRYTVDDVLESVQRLAGHLPPAAKSRGNIYSLISDRRTRRQISKSLASEKPPQRGPVKADHSQRVVLRDRYDSPRPASRTTSSSSIGSSIGSRDYSNKENEVQGIAINRLPRFASIRKTSSFTDLSPNTKLSLAVPPRDTGRSMSSTDYTGASRDAKTSAMPSRPLSAAYTRTKVLTQSNHHYQNLQEFSGNATSRQTKQTKQTRQTRPQSEIIDPAQQETLRRTRSALQLHWKNGTLNEIWC